MNLRSPRTVLSLVLALAVPGVCAGLASAQTQAPSSSAPATPSPVTTTTPNIVIDGTPVVFDQPPIAVAGRIFVPLRGVFERLGASVVYQNGQINATSGAHTIGLRVGQPTATIDGTTQALESPPLLVAGRVLVPLRFVATALGATVRFDAQTQTASIARAVTAPPAAVGAPVAPTATPRASAVVIRLIREEPANGTRVERLRPEISASFAEAIDPNTVRIEVDGRDVSTDAYVSARSFAYEPTYDLPPGPHEVLVGGRTAAHEPFEDRFAFASVAATAASHNYLSGVEPPNGTVITSPLVISGITRPRARVRVVATSSDTVAHFSELAAGSASTAVAANARGAFTVRLELVETGAGILDVRIDSTSPEGGVAVKTLRLRL